MTAVLEIHFEGQLTAPGKYDGDSHRRQCRHPAGDEDGRMRIQVFGNPADHRAADGLAADQHHDVQAHYAPADPYVGADLDQLV